MKNYRIVSIDEAAAMKEEAAAWFSEKWDVPREATLRAWRNVSAGKGRCRGGISFWTVMRKS